MNNRLFIGLMSGTSMDGIDAALIDLPSNTFIAGLTCPYSSQVKNLLNEKIDNLKSFSQLNTLLGKEFAKAALDLLNKEGIPASAISAIGSHGQTLCHDATADIPYTVQLGCAHTIAELTGITVVADFRTRDLVVGGQGAPFAPIYHQALFKHQELPLAVVNIGGISNLTYLIDEFRVRGYDLGPGNCLLDAWIQKHLGCEYDNRGDWAASGCVIRTLLEQILQDPYFKRTPPKSIGKEYFSLEWLANYSVGKYPPNDVQATLLMLTAITIAEGIKNETLAPSQLLICGGGAHNAALLNVLAELLPTIKVSSTETMDINPDFIEAAMIAWLAEKTINRTPLNLNAITGAKFPVVLGAIYPVSLDKGNCLRV